MTGIVSRLKKQQGTTATHRLESQGYALSAGQKHSKDHSCSHPGEPRAGIVSRLGIQQGTTAAHILKSQGQALSAGQKHSKILQPLTYWRTRNRHCQQARNTPMHHSYSLSGEPRTGSFSRLETQQGTTATHILESQGQALSAN